MKKSEAENKLCWRSMSAGKLRKWTSTDCMAWVRFSKYEEKPLAAGERVDDGWKTNYTIQHRHVPDPENGYCDALPKAQE